MPREIKKNCVRLSAALTIIFILQACGISTNEILSEPVTQPHFLKINEGFTNPLGFYNAKPNFSWRLKPNGAVLSQTKYQIIVASHPNLLAQQADLWDSGIIETGKSTFVEYEGKPLISRQKVYWQVRYWDQDNRTSDWSDIATFELGLLSNNDWSAQWIEIDSKQAIKLNQFDTPIHAPQYLRTAFTSNKEIIKARLYITAKGLFDAFINGNKVGDDVLTPGYTPYKKRIETLTYDVTGHLQDGENAIGIQLAEGWYAGRFGPKRHWHKKLALTPKVLAQLEIEYSDGTIQTVNTDDNWQATQNGPIRTSGLYDGEHYDANYDLGAWSQPAYDTFGWSSVKTSPIEAAVLLQPKRHFTLKNKGWLTPVTISRLDEDTYIYDLGQNMVGVPKLNIPMKKGQTLKIRFAEMLQKDGSLYTKNYGSALSTNYYTAAEDGVIEWQPAFTFHGFQFVEISNFDTIYQPDKSWVTGVVQYTDFDLTGKFETSNIQLNQLQSNIKWGLLGNFFDVPLDCPQRSERLGWTGDALAFAPTSLYVADVHAFWAAWMQSIREEQFESNGIPVVVPNEVGVIVQSGWSDAAVTIPWDTYNRVGDINILADNYNMMTRWINYHQTHLTDGISSMSTVGDWLQPYSQRKDNRRGHASHELISTAFYARSVEITAKTALALGKLADADKYRHLHEEIKQRFQAYFFNEQGETIQGEQTQTSYLLAIGFDLLTDEMTEKAGLQLVKQIKLADNHLRTGFLGTPLLAPVLDKIGRADIAFDLLFKQTYPSWLYSVNQGATTMWERWDGFSHERGFAKKQGSLNHYAYGAIGQWLYERLVGIRPATPGYQSIVIEPLLTDKLERVSGSFESVYGMIKSSWNKQNDQLTMNVTIPPNTSSLIHVPLTLVSAESTRNTVNFDAQSISINASPLSPLTHEIIEQSETHVVLKVMPGEYTINVQSVKGVEYSNCVDTCVIIN